jgi:hypothetical protein
MRLGWALLLALLLASLSGCFTADPDPSLTRHDAKMPFAAPDSDDLVVMEIATLDCNVHDAYINGALWDVVDESANAERQTLLRENGFRAGILGPTPPERLIDVLTADRNEMNLRQCRVAAGSPAALSIGPERPQCSYDLKRNGVALPVELDKAKCVVEVVATAAKDGATKLTFTPLVRHGWDLQAQQQPSERYDWLSWELTVMPNEYLVAGTTSAYAGTLGQRTFLNTESQAPAQRLLLIRVVRAPCGDRKPNEQGNRPPPLAQQAAWSSVRGNAP